MKVITAPEYYEPAPEDVRLFLAGGITGCRNWQKEVIEALKQHELPNLVIFNPRRDNFHMNDPHETPKQIKWEFLTLESSDIFSVYFEANESLQPIVLYEVGRNIPRLQMRFPNDWDDRLIITVEQGYKREEDVLNQVTLATGTIGFVSNPEPKDAVKEHVEEIIRCYKIIDQGQIIRW